jgi:hypothetical protein
MYLGPKDFAEIGNSLNRILRDYNYQVSPLSPAGKPGKIVKTVREYRLQLINKNNDTSQKLIENFGRILKLSNKKITSIKYNAISPNSSKFPSYAFSLSGHNFDLVIGRGANKGENFESNTVTGLSKAFSVTKYSKDYVELINQLNQSNRKFASVEIKSVSQRKGSTKKEGIPIEKLGAIIGDIVLTDNTQNNWFISLKDVNGDTFSSYSGAASLFNSEGDLMPSSPGAKFLNSFGVDLNQIQDGFDLRNDKKKLRTKIKIEKADSFEIKKIFERAWGMNYFYVRKLTNGWKVFWMDRKKLDDLTKDIIVTDVRYPTVKSKQITIYCGNKYQNYVIELRNSKAGEYPNDTKFKVK